MPLELSRADEDDHDAVVGLIEAAARWLPRTQDPGQWAQPWPSEEDRSNRIRRDLTAGKTWLVRDSGLAVATITADPEDYGAQWIRVDVWRTNKELHAYYEDQGFESCGVCRDPAYPAGALFQKPTEHLQKLQPPLFHEA